MATKKVASVTLGIQSGTTRTVYATWPKTSFKKQDKWRVIWYYYAGDIRFVGNDSQVSTGTTIVTYSAPNNASSVTCVVIAVPKKKAGWSGGSGTSGSYPLPDETDYKPSAPSTPEIKVEDNKVTATVSNYTHPQWNGQIYIQIVMNDEKIIGEGVATNSIGLSSFSVNLSGSNGNRYKARALAKSKKAGSDSDWSSYSNNVYEAPPAVQIKELKTVSEGSADISWDPPRTPTTINPKTKKKVRGKEIPVDSYTLEYTSTVVDGVPVFDTGSSDVQTIDGIIATHALASNLELSKRWYFRLRANNPGGASDWSDIKDIMIGTKPDKPTIWSYTTVGKIGTAVVLNWVHSSKDGSDQSGAKIMAKINDGTESVIATLTTENTYSYDTSSLHDGDKLNWKVCTRGTQGISEEWGDYSEYREIVFYEPPSITFTVGRPGEHSVEPVIESFPIEIEGTAGPASQTPVAYYVSISSNDSYDISGEDGIEVHVIPGQEIYSSYIPADSNAFNLELTPGDLYLHTDSTYTVTVTVAMSNALSATASHVFRAIWEAPVWDPDADVIIDDNTLVAYVRPYCSDQWGFEYREGFTLAVYRIDFDGNLTLIDGNIDAGDNATITDLHPSLDYARYRIVATDLETGVVYYNDINAIPINANMAVIQWDGEARTFFADPENLADIDNDWSGTVLRLPYNIDVSDDISPDVSLVEYIGRSHPVSYYGTQQGSTSRWSVEVPKSDIETIARVRALAIYQGDVYVREPSGTGYWANVKTSTNISHNKPIVSVSFTITRVEGGA